MLCAGVAGNDFAAGHANADGDGLFASGLALGVEQLDHLDHVQRRAHGRQRRFFQRQRRAKDGHQAIANHLVDDTALATDGVKHQRVIGVEQLDGFFGRLGFDHRGKAADVGKHDGGMHPLAAQ